jgi:hypothetical protein
LRATLISIPQNPQVFERKSLDDGSLSVLNSPNAVAVRPLP